jgi:hypothetical protein
MKNEIEPRHRGKARVKPDGVEKIEAVERDHLLQEFGLVTEGQLAVLLDVDVKTLKNRARKNLPPYTKVGGKRLFFRDDVVRYMRDHMVMD